MAILNPDHLLDQASMLAKSPAAGTPRQVNLRRAVSDAYYAVFHMVLAAAADEIVGTTMRQTSRYALVYRSLDHRRIKDLCNDLAKPNLSLNTGPISRRVVSVAGSSHSASHSETCKNDGTAQTMIRRRVSEPPMSISSSGSPASRSTVTGERRPNASKRS